MPIRPFGGYNPNSPWPPDDSTGIQWGDVDLPGIFGPGGFRPQVPGTPMQLPNANPRTMLPGNPAPGPLSGSSGPQFAPPPNSTIPLSKTIASRTGNPFTDAYVNPITGQPEFVGGPGATIGPGSPAAGGGFPNILSWLNPAGRAAIAAGAAMTPTQTANDAAPTDAWFQRPSGVGGMPGPQVTNPPATPFTQPNAPIDPYGLTRVNAPIDPFDRSLFAPGAGAGPGRKPSGPVVRPGAGAGPGRSPSGPAAAKQKPNLGYYSEIDQPNIARSGNVQGGIAQAPRMGVLDFSKLFARKP